MTIKQGCGAPAPSGQGVCSVDHGKAGGQHARPRSPGSVNHEMWPVVPSLEEIAAREPSQPMAADKEIYVALMAATQRLGYPPEMAVYILADPDVFAIVAESLRGERTTIADALRLRASHPCIPGDGQEWLKYAASVAERGGALPGVGALPAPSTPTQDAYEAACQALETQRKRADDAEAAIERARELARAKIREQNEVVAEDCAPWGVYKVPAEDVLRVLKGEPARGW